MAKKSKIAKNEQRKAIVARYAEKRLELRKTLVDPNASDEAREAARLGLRWARAVQAGDAVNVLVPSAEAPAWSGWRQTGAHRVLAVGDETAVPALVSVAEELADPFGGFDGEADLVLELPHDGQAADLIAERLAVPEPWDWRAVTELTDRGRVRLHVGRRAPGAPSGSWAHARLAALLGVDPDDAGGPVAPPAASVEREWTVAALEADERPEAYVFLAGESAMVRALRRLSVGPGGVPKKHVSFMGYWREGQAES